MPQRACHFDGGVKGRRSKVPLFTFRNVRSLNCRSFGSEARFPKAEVCRNRVGIVSGHGFSRATTASKQRALALPPGALKRTGVKTPPQAASSARLKPYPDTRRCRCPHWQCESNRTRPDLGKLSGTGLKPAPPWPAGQFGSLLQTRQRAGKKVLRPIPPFRIGLYIRRARLAGRQGRVSYRSSGKAVRLCNVLSQF